MQKPNGAYPIFSTDLGKFTVFNPVHPQNAISPISVKLSGKTNSVIFSQNATAFAAINLVPFFTSKRPDTSVETFIKQSST